MDRLQIAHDELYVSVRKLHDMAMGEIVQRCLASTIFTIVGFSALEGLGVKTPNRKKQVKYIMEEREAWDKVPVGAILKANNG